MIRCYEEVRAISFFVALRGPPWILRRYNITTESEDLV